MARRKKSKHAPLLLLVAAALVAAVYLFFPDLFSQASQPIPDGAMELTALDVGQGDSLLIRCGGKTALIDAGTAEYGPAVVEALQTMGVNQLDLVVVTHPHADHMGGMAQVLQAIPAGQFWMPDAVNSTDAFETMLDALEKNGAKTRLAVRGDTFSLGDCKLSVLSPEPGAESGDLNDLSLVIEAQFGDVRAMLCGDAGSNVEREILKNGMVPRCQIVKSGHHGSKTASSDAFLQALQPAYAIVSCGEGNTYGHPDPEAVERLETAGAEILRTDLQGRITFLIEGGEIHVTTGR